MSDTPTPAQMREATDALQELVVLGMSGCDLDCLTELEELALRRFLSALARANGAVQCISPDQSSSITDRLRMLEASSAALLQRAEQAEAEVARLRADRRSAIGGNMSPTSTD